MDSWVHLCVRRRALSVAAVCFFALSAQAQWEMEESHTTANLRGIASVGGGVAWASGVKGTVLRTEDGGYVWQGCAVPPGAETLDFRAIQAFDEQTAIVMSAGPGSESRLYRTTDGCLSWKLLLTNPDKQGFWDALRFRDRENGMLLGDPVNGHFVVMTTANGGTTWQRNAAATVDDASGQGAFAASNSSLLLQSANDWSFCTGGIAGPHVWRSAEETDSGLRLPGVAPTGHASSSEELISESKGESIGCFSLAAGGGETVAVGGDYTHPDAGEDNAWTTRIDPGDAAGQAEAKRHPMFRFVPALVRPAGYLSSVAYDEGAKAWIAVGPTGTDVSTDGGVRWRALKPGAGSAGVDRDWNALSLPFVVGPHGRVAKLRSDFLQFSAPATAAK